MPGQASRNAIRLFGLWLLAGLWLTRDAQAAPPLVFVTDTAEPGLRTWWHEGDLLVAHALGDERPGIRPLADATPIPVPTTMNGWSALGETCATPPVADFDLDGTPARVIAEGDWTRPAVKVLVGDRVVAQAWLGRPARICEIAAGQLDTVPGPEIIVAWRLNGTQTPDQPTDVRGLTIFRIPATAR